MKIIVNADDFGISPAVNEAVMCAHRAGILTSASLMTTGEAFEDAIAKARETPSLAVGLHLVVTNGRSVLPYDEIPHLVNEQGYFPGDLLRLGWRYRFNQQVREELSKEIAAQFERFATTGLPLSHVDGHLHMHLHPTVFKLILPLAKQYGAKGIRIPRDDLWLALRYNQRNAATKVVWAILFKLLSVWCLRSIGNQHLVVPHRAYGLMQTGRMTKDYVIGLLRSINVSTAELFFHPTTAAIGEKHGPNPGDLATLLSSGVRQVVRDRGLSLTTYPALYEAANGAFAPTSSGAMAR